MIAISPALLPAPLHRLALRLAHAVLRLWWRWARPELVGCSVMLFDPQGRILLVRHSYGHGRWGLPGGAVKRGEDPAEAIRRELREEVGCELMGLCHAGTATRDYHGARNRVEMFRATSADAPVPDGREIIAARFFAWDAWPGDLSSGAREWLSGLAAPGSEAGRALE